LLRCQVEDIAQGIIAKLTLFTFLWAKETGKDTLTAILKKDRE